MGKAIRTSAVCESLIGSPESETCGMCISSVSGNREISEGAVYSPVDSPAGEGQGRNPGVYTSEKSDRPIVPEKPSNKAPSNIANDHGAAEVVEERGLTKGNLFQVRQVPYSVTEA